jgi:glutathione S-transferase
MFRFAFRRHVRMAAIGMAACGALARASCDSAPPIGLGEQRRATVVHRPGTVHTGTPLTLEYFALRGLGELPRLILEATGLPYDCVFHYLGGEWRSRAAFGQLPVLHDGELTISQSRAIVRHLARKTCIDGATEADKARVDMWCEFHRDLNDKKKATHDMAGHADAPKLKQMFDAAERQLGAGDGVHLVGSSLTVADVLLFSTLHQMEETNPGVLRPWPRLCAFVAAFATQPNIAAYLASDARVPLTPNEAGPQPNIGLPGYAFVAPMRPGSYQEEWVGLGK